MHIKFIKMHSLGNDFIIIDKRDVKFDISIEQIKDISHRKLGIGCDQLLIMQSSTDCDFEAQIYNSCGSKAHACINGSMALALISGESKGSIKIADRAINFTISQDDLVTIDAGKPSFEYSHIPISFEVNAMHVPFELRGFNEGACVNIGNSHLVFFVSDLEKIDIAKYGKYFETHDYFPERINVNFAQIIDKKNIALKVWERDAGYTMSCGSGACATYAVARKLSLVEQEIKINFDIGYTTVMQNNESKISITGKPAIVFKGETFLS